MMRFKSPSSLKLSPPDGNSALVLVVVTPTLVISKLLQEKKDLDPITLEDQTVTPFIDFGLVALRVES